MVYRENKDKSYIGLLSKQEESGVKINILEP